MNNNFDYQGAKQAGYSDQEIQSYLASKQPQPQQQPQQEGGSMLTNLLPLIGGVGGSLLGSVAGPVGTIGGGGAGAGLGQLIAYLIQKKNPTVQDVGSQAVAGTVGGVGGKLLEPVFGVAGKVLSKFLPDALDKAGTGFISSQYNLPRQTARALSLKDTINGLQKYGITNINDVGPAADVVTGQNGVITKALSDAVSQAKPVDTSGIRRMVQDLVSTNPTTGDDKILNFVDKQLSAMNGGASGSVETAAHPLEVLQALRQFEAKANEINRIAKPQRSTEAVNTAHIYGQVADELEHRLFGSPAAEAGMAIPKPGEFAGETIPASTDAFGTPTPEQTFSSAPQAGPQPMQMGEADNVILKNNPIKPGTPMYDQLAKISPVLANDAATAKTAGELRSLAKYFVRGNIAANETEAGSQIGFNNAAGAVKGVGKMIQNPLNLLAVPLGSDVVNAGAGQGMKAAASAIRGIPMPANIDQILATITGQGAGQVLNQPAAPTQTEASTAIPQPTSQQTPATGDSTSPQDAKQEQMKQLLGAVMLAHAKNASELIAAYNFLNPQSKQSETARVDKQRTNGLLSVIQAMQGDVQQAKHIGPFGDLIQKAEQKTGVAGGGDPATIRLNQNMALLKQMIATEVHRRGMSESSLKAMYDAFPQSNESHATYIQKLNNLQEIMQTYFGDFSNPAEDSSMPQLPATAGQ